ncbi:hypothetical protein [Kibdelosporangium philippinense]|uniref:hypothetical protein n=1 Tax=Kibdelosporangium philippinense TaxID=211113 RepID=UPI00361AFAEF
MAKHQRATPLIRLLARLGWQRDPNLWTVRCRDGRGRRARLHIRLTADGVTLTASSRGPWTLTPLEAGRLRGATRDAVLTFDRLAGSGHGVMPPPARTAAPASPQPMGDPVPRRRVRLDPSARPSTAEIASRIAAPATLTPEVNHDRQTDKSTVHTGRATVAA